MFARARVSVLALAGSIVIASMAVVGAQGKNPHVGTWKLNVAKSTSSGPVAKSRVLTISEAGKALTIKVDEVAGDGSASNWSFTTEDGKEVPVSGTPRMDSAVSTLKGPSARHTVYKKSGKTVLEVESVVSADGKTMTTTAKGLDAAGKQMTSKSVYEKQ